MKNGFLQKVLFPQFTDELNVSQHLVFGDRPLLLLESTERSIPVVEGLTGAPSVLELVLTLGQQESAEGLSGGQAVSEQ
jgi:hypothetical protein